MKLYSLRIRLCLCFLRMSLGFGAGGYSERSFCELGTFPKALLARNETDGTFHLVKRLHPLTQNLTEGGFRRLEFSDMVSGSEQKSAEAGSEWIQGIQASEVRYLVEDADEIPHNASLFYAQECSCFGIEYPTVYCPFTVDACLRPKWRNDKQVPGCMNRAAGGSFGGAAFMLMLGLYIFGIVYLLLSSIGAHVAGFVISCGFRRWNERLVQSILANDDPAQMRRRIREVLDELPENIENTVMGEGVFQTAGPRMRVSLRLRKKRYCGTKVVDPEEAMQAINEEENQCVICHLPLEDGDKVGQLACNHDFHVHCLKNWLQRRNVCPLCQARDVAEVHFDIMAEDPNDRTAS